MNKPLDIAKNRPAETATPIATVFAVLIAKMFGVTDADTVVYIALALSFVPAIVTWLVHVIRDKNGTTYQPPEA